MMPGTCLSLLALSLQPMVVLSTSCSTSAEGAEHQHGQNSGHQHRHDLGGGECQSNDEPSKVLSLLQANLKMNVNRTLDHDSTLPRRPSLMYSEMAKTASGSLRRLLPNVVKGCELPARWDVFPHNDLDCGCYATTGDKYAASKQDRLRHFVIGSVREPCDRYVSSWSYKPEEFPEIPDPSNGSKLTMDTLKDVVPAKKSALRSFQKQFGPNPHVDCWVVTDDFSASLRRCLEMFETQGGQVNWDFGGLVVALDPIAKDTDTGKDKNHPGVQLEHHAPCAAYFDSQMSAYIEQVDAPLYARFGWSGCCGGASQSHQQAEHDRLIVKAIANTTPQHAHGLRQQQLRRGEPTCHHLRRKKKKH